MARKQAGFTLVEILVVIAIMVMLAGIMLPALARAREGSRRTECMSNLHQIATALKLYKLDQRVYPGDLSANDFAVTTLPNDRHWYGYTDGSGQQQPGYGLGTLYPDYISSLRSFCCPNNPIRSLDDENGHFPPSSGTPAGNEGWKSYNSYDGWDRLINELKYQRNWLGTSSGDTNWRRQLRWLYPPDDTVVTWCSYHRHVADPSNSQAGDSGSQQGSQDIVLYLDGHASVVSGVPTNSGHESQPGS